MRSAKYRQSVLGILILLAWFLALPALGGAVPLAKGKSAASPPPSTPFLVSHAAAATSSSAGAVTLNLPGNVPLVMVRIPAGSFMMGSPARERSRTASEGPEHKVTLSHDFYLGRYEVTQAQWKAVTGVNPAHIQGANGFSEDLNKPVESVSWNEIAGPGGFIAKVNQHLAATGRGQVRLPSEAEWVYACRAGTTTRFYFGDSLLSDDEASNGPAGAAAYPGTRGDYMWFSANSGGTTHPVGTRRPNAWGLYDMAGNVWEWCQDWAHDDYRGAPAAGRAWETPAGEWRLVHGGAWDNHASYCRSANQSTYYPDDRSDDVGFRLVWTP